jgi:hypothetical protein
VSGNGGGGASAIAMAGAVTSAGGIWGDHRAVLAELVCCECEQRSAGSASGWHGYLFDLDDDGQDEVVFFCCPGCAARDSAARTQRIPAGSITTYSVLALAPTIGEHVFGDESGASVRDLPPRARASEDGVVNLTAPLRGVQFDQSCPA